MIPAGTDAPGFELPALIDGGQRRLSLDEFLGEDVVILTFYPADFNPACDAESDLDELDLFTMQKDVEVLAIGPDTLYSHAAFADEYDLHIPLLSDTRHEVAETYDVAFTDDVGQRLVERSVFVVDHDGVIQYAWSTQNMAELPKSDEITDAIADTGGDDTAFARYRVGHAHYTEGRRAFTSAMGSYRDSEWMVAQSDFKRAREEFEEAADHFDSSVRFVDDETFGTYYDRAQEKATALWQAADWLSKSASHYSSGAGAEAQRLRDDAEQPLENARDLGEPIDPDEWPPDEDSDDADSILPQAPEREKTLMVDIDEEVAKKPADDGTDPDGEGALADDGAEGTAQATAETTDESANGEDEIDDAELEEIEAELAASQPENPEGEELSETPTSMVDAPPADESVSQDDADGVDDDEDEIDDDDLEELEAEMEASQSAAEAASTPGPDAEESIDGESQGSDAGPADPEPGDTGLDEADADDGGPDAGTAFDDAGPSGESEGADSPSQDLGEAGDGADAGLDDELDADSGDDPADDSPGEPPPDPHADLASSGSSAPGASRSLEPAGEPEEDDAGEEADDVSLDDEPEGASDEDLADIPTAEDLAEDDDGDSDVDADGDGGY